jgi:hypothetical protein
MALNLFNYCLPKKHCEFPQRNVSMQAENDSRLKG